MIARNDAISGMLLGTPEYRPGIAGTAYDTAWLAGIATAHNACEPEFPASLQWLREHQLPDGSWGGVVRYEHDRILCTLAALASLATPSIARFGRLRRPDSLPSGASSADLRRSRSSMRAAQCENEE